MSNERIISQYINLKVWRIFEAVCINGYAPDFWTDFELFLTVTVHCLQWCFCTFWSLTFGWSSNTSEEKDMHRDPSSIVPVHALGLFNKGSVMRCFPSGRTTERSSGTLIPKVVSFPVRSITGRPRFTRTGRAGRQGFKAILLTFIPSNRCQLFLPGFRV